MRAQVTEMIWQQHDMASHIQNMESDYMSMQSELAMLKRNMTCQDGLMQSMIQYFTRYENGGAPL